MESIMIKYDPYNYWDEFLSNYMIRHEKIHGDYAKFILYYQDEWHLLRIGYEFGMFCQKKILTDGK